MARNRTSRLLAVGCVALAGALGAHAQSEPPAAPVQPVPPVQPPPVPQSEAPPIDPQTGAVRVFSFGDVPPRIKVESWLRGDPVGAFEPGTVYVVWFFSTWSKASEEAIPTLRAVHEQFQGAGVRLVGVSVWETTKPAPGDAYVERLRAYLGAEPGALIPGSVAFDGAAGEMAQTWMRGADRRSIPSAFVIDAKGRVAWMGHPLSVTEPLATIVSEVVAGTFDALKARERAQDQQKTVDAIRRVDRRLFRAMEAQDGKDAMRLVEEMIALRQEDGVARVQDVFELALMENKNADAVAWALRLAEGPIAGNALVLNNLAWGIATDERLETRDLDAALILAEKANTAAQGREAYVLDTLARVCFERGEVARAVELQERAIEHARADQKDEYRAVLEAYRAGRRP